MLGRRKERGWTGMVGDVAEPGVLERCEDGEEPAIAGADIAGLDNGLVGEGVDGDAVGFQEPGDGTVAAGLIEFVFAVEVERGAVVVAGGLEHQWWDIVRGRRGVADQLDVGGHQPGSKVAECAQDQVGFGRGEVVGVPLGGRDDEERNHLIGVGTGMVEGGVVGKAEVRTQPEEGFHAGSYVGAKDSSG